MRKSKKITKQVSLDQDEQILIVKKQRTSIFRTFFVRSFVTILIVLGSLIVTAPFLLRLHGDVILTKLLFQTWSRYYPWIDITKPEQFGLNGVNLYERTESNVTVGLWYIVPSTVEVDPHLPTLGDHLKRYIHSKDKPIIMYLHGQDGTRATNYRANHYRVMTSFGNHIIALDYRGYGDSTGTPTINGIVHDVLHVFHTIRKACPDNPITIWGHSMGTGVGLWTLNHLFHNETNLKKPSGVVLEAPFYNTMQGLVSYPLTRILKINPYFIRAALDSLTSVQLNFPNNEIISLLPLPIVVIHAEDDGIIPYYHAELIQDYVKVHREKNLPSVRFITVPRAAGCGHNHIYLYQKFQEIVSDFDFLQHPAPA